MSRSKKAPYYTDNGQAHRRASKKSANKAVRQAKFVSSSTVKKLYNSWNINDYSFPAPQDPKAYRK